jgi:transposase
MVFTVLRTRSAKEVDMANDIRIAETYTVGIDLGDRKSVYCVLDEEGKVIRRGAVSTNRQAFANEFQPGGFRAVLECGTHSRWCSDLLRELGCEVFVANPRKIPLIFRETNKTDKEDAQKLARLGRFDPGLLSPIKHRSLDAHNDLSVIKARDTLVRIRASLVNAVRAAVKAFGERLPSGSTDGFPKRAAPLIPEPLKDALTPLLDTISQLTNTIRSYDRQITAMAEKKYPETSALTQVTGVGDLTALTFLLVLEDPGRFRNGRTVGAFLGCTPRLDQSGEVDKELPITKAGNGFMRRLLVSAAHYILGPRGPDTDLKRYGEKLIARGGRAAKKRAAVAVARKLAVLLYRLWVTGEVYEPLRNSCDADPAMKEVA